MRVVVDGDEIELGAVEVNPTIGMVDYSRRVTDDFGETTVVPRGFARELSVRLAIPTVNVDTVFAELVALKDTLAVWEAHETLEWLKVEGFYKDFQIDYAVPPLSYCTLTVTGIAETEVVVDVGEDPAPDGQGSKFLLQPGSAGEWVGLGNTESSATAGITNYSRKNVDDFGAVTIVQRGYAKRMDVQALIRTDAVDVVANRIASVRATPSMWTGQTGYDALTMEGFFKNFRIEVGETVSKLTLSIEGLTTATPFVDPGDLFSGIQTDRYPTPAPLEPAIGSLYFDATNHPYRFEGRALTFLDVGVTFLGQPIYTSGWVSVQDKGLRQLFEELEDLDNDSLLTISEKIRIAIPNDAALEAEYQSLLAQASAVGVSVSEMTAARAAWIALRNSLSPPWNDTTVDTPLVRSSWDATLEEYRTEIEAARAKVTVIGSVTVIPPAAQTVTTNSSGTVASGQYPRALTPTVKRGSVDIRTTDAVQYSIATSGITATVNSTDGSSDKGKITVTAGTSGYIDLTVVVETIPLGPYRINFTANAASTYSGTSSSGFITIGNIKQGWVEAVISPNTTGQVVTAPFTASSFMKAWITGGRALTTASENDPFVLSTTLSDATIFSASDASTNVTVFFLGDA